MNKPNKREERTREEKNFTLVFVLFFPVVPFTMKSSKKKQQHRPKRVYNVWLLHLKHASISLCSSIFVWSSHLRYLQDGTPATNTAWNRSRNWAHKFKTELNLFCAMRQTQLPHSISEKLFSLSDIIKNLSCGAPSFCQTFYPHDHIHLEVCTKCFKSNEHKKKLWRAVNVSAFFCCSSTAVESKFHLICLEEQL